MHEDLFNLLEVQAAITKSQVAINGTILDQSSRKGFDHAFYILHDIQQRIEDLIVTVETRRKNQKKGSMKS